MSFDDITSGSLNLTDTKTGQIVLLVISIISLLIFIFYIIAYFKLFKKAGTKGIYSIIPIYNIWVLFEMSGMKGWLALIPIVNIFAGIVSLYKLPIKFGKGKVFAILNLFFSPILIFVLAFDKSEYELNYETKKDVLTGEEAVEAFAKKYMSDDGINVDNTEIPVVNMDNEYYKQDDKKEKIDAIDPFIDFGLKEEEKRDDLNYNGSTTIPDPIVKPKPKFIIPDDNK